MYVLELKLVNEKVECNKGAHIVSCTVHYRKKDTLYKKWPEKQKARMELELNSVKWVTVTIWGHSSVLDLWLLISFNPKAVVARSLMAQDLDNHVDPPGSIKHSFFNSWFLQKKMHAWCRQSCNTYIIKSITVHFPKNIYNVSSTKGKLILKNKTTKYTYLKLCLIF